MEIIISILIFLFILSVLVLIHELGHFLVARKLNIKVEEFGFGFPVTPALFSIKRGETKYSFYPVLIGGFVKLYGEDEAGGGRVSTKDHTSVSGIKRAFFARPVGQRAAVVIAGVVMNAILAAAIFYTYFFISGFKAQIPLLTDYRFALVTQQNKVQLIVQAVAPNSPASKAGLQPCSQKHCAILTMINGEKITSAASFSNAIKMHSGQEVTLTWQDVVTKKMRAVKITPRTNPPKGEGALGIAYAVQQTAVLSYSTPVQRLLSGFVHPFNLMKYQINVLSKFIATAFKEKSVRPVSDAVSGPIGIAVITGQILNIPDMKDRILAALELTGLLSISLAFFNILPVPALDGGRLFFILIEAVFRKKVNQRVEVLAHTIGMILLLSLILLVTVKEVSQFILPLFSR